MASNTSDVPPQLLGIEKEVRDIFEILATGFHRIIKIKNEEKRAKQLEELTARMREAKRLIKDFEKIMREDSTSECHKVLNEKKQSMIKELNSYVALRKTYTISIGSYKKDQLNFSNAGPPSRDLVGSSLGPLCFFLSCFVCHRNMVYR